MLTIKTPLPQAQKIKQFLLKNNLLGKEHIPKKEGDFIYFPLTKKPKKKFKNTKITNKTLLKIQRPKTLQQLLKKK